jgi:hypothetical protein
MTTPVSVYMYVNPGTAVPTGPDCTLFEDRNHQTPLLKVVTVIGNSATDHGSYSTSSCAAIAYILPAEYSVLVTDLGTTGKQVRVDLTYDDSAVGSTKPLIGSPTFTLIDPLPLSALAHAVGAIEARVESGVSSEIRDEISHIRIAVDSIKETVEKLASR